MSDVIQVVNWDKFQHYRDRSPPWIKLHRSLLDNRQWHELSGDASKLLAECWLLASNTMDGTIPLSTTDLAWKLRRKTAAVRLLLQELETHGFLDLSKHDASTVKARRARDATPETETEDRGRGQSSVSSLRSETGAVAPTEIRYAG